MEDLHFRDQTLHLAEIECARAFLWSFGLCFCYYFRGPLIIRLSFLL